MNTSHMIGEFNIHTQMMDIVEVLLYAILIPLLFLIILSLAAIILLYYICRDDELVHKCINWCKQHLFQLEH